MLKEAIARQPDPQWKKEELAPSGRTYLPQPSDRARTHASCGRTAKTTTWSWSMSLDVTPNFVGIFISEFRPSEIRAYLESGGTLFFFLVLLSTTFSYSQSK